MTTAVQHRRGTTAEHAAFTGLEGEVTIDTTKDTAVIHDGTLAGGYPLAKENLANVTTSGLSSIDGASTASDDKFFIYDQSATSLKTITRAELNNAIEQDALANVAITGGTINGTTIGGTTAAAVSATTLTTSSTVTHNGGTANGVAYLNGSKVLTTGSALTFDGTNLGVGGAATDSAAFGRAIDLRGTTGGAYYAATTDNTTRALFGAYSGAGYVGTETNHPVVLRINATEQMRLTSTGLGIGTSSPNARLTTISSASGVGAQINTSLASAGSTAIQLGGYLVGFESNTGVTLRAIHNHGATNASSLAFEVNGTTEAMRLDASGNLGIGTSSPAYKLDVVDTGGNLFRFTRNTEQIGSYVSAGNVYFGTLSNNPLLLMTNSTTRATLDSSGNLGLGVTPSAWNSSYKALDIASGGAAVFGGTSFAGIANNSFVNSSFQEIYKTSNPALQYLQVVGQHRWYTAPSGTAGDAISFSQAMTLNANGNYSLGTTSPTEIAGYITQSINGTSGSLTEYRQNNSNTFRVGSDSSSGGFLFTQAANPIRFGTDDTERARIDSSGNLLVGTTSNPNASHQIWKNNPNGIVASLQNTNTTNGFVLDLVSQSTAGTGFSLIRGYVTSGATQVFAVQGNGNVVNTNGSYGAISDAKLKENVTDATPKLEKLQQVRVVNYNLIGDEHKQIGVIAQELEQIFPGMVEESPDRDAEGNDLGTTTKSVKYSVFVPMLIKAIQEQQAIIEDMKTRLAALESN